MSAHLWLIGMMGSGKSIVGEAIASMTGRTFVDLDREIEARTGATIAAIFSREGETRFRELESEAIREAARRGTPSVIATGGGAVLRHENIDAMRACGTVVWLRASAGTLATRLERERASRPLLAGGDLSTRLASLLAKREPLYRAAAHRAVDTDGRPADAVAREIAGAAGVRVTTPAASYDVHVGRGLLSRAGEIVRDACGGAKAVVVTDGNVAKLHLAPLRRSLARSGYAVSTVVIPAGERHKNLRTVAKIWEALLAARIDRATPVVALGGGVLGDLAGFAAATVLRGVPVVQLPTTLVAQVDSAIGGKTGFDLPRGKNLVGAFKHPAAVLADVDLLRTLPGRELRAGMGEVVKYGAIADETLLAALERDPDLVEVVRRCARIKAEVVSRDPEEKGERAILNFGHTVGHAIEAATGYRSWLHGEAVAAGMVAEAELAAERGRCAAADVERLVALLARLGLPLAAPKGAARYVTADKKRFGAAIRMPVLRALGVVEIEAVPAVDIQRFLKSS